MIWILGAEGLFHALFILTGWQIWSVFSQQFQHSAWHGLTFYDLIFPLFIFLSGVTLGISQLHLRGASSEKKIRTYKKAFVRLLLLCFLGVLYNHGWGQGIPVEPDKVRYASVLMRIGIAWFFTALIVWHFDIRQQYIFLVFIPIFYWVLQTFVPIPSGELGPLTPSVSWNAWVDQTFLPGITYQNSAADPEGILSHFSAIFNGLTGAVFGRYLVHENKPVMQRLLALIITSTILVFLGYFWSLNYPLNKSLWTSSFAVVTTGISGLLLCLFYWLFDVQKLKGLGYFFAVIGANAILLYLLSSVFNWQYLVQSLFGKIIETTQDSVGLLIGVLALVFFQWFFAHLLYKKKIFLKV